LVSMAIDGVPSRSVEGDFWAVVLAASEVAGPPHRSSSASSPHSHSSLESVLRATVRRVAPPRLLRVHTRRGLCRAWVRALLCCNHSTHTLSRDSTWQPLAHEISHVILSLSQQYHALGRCYGAAVSAAAGNAVTAAQAHPGRPDQRQHHRQDPPSNQRHQSHKLSTQSTPGSNSKPTLQQTAHPSRPRWYAAPGPLLADNASVHALIAALGGLQRLDEKRQLLAITVDNMLLDDLQGSPPGGRSLSALNLREAAMGPGPSSGSLLPTQSCLELSWDSDMHARLSGDGEAMCGVYSPLVSDSLEKKHAACSHSYAYALTSSFSACFAGRRILGRRSSVRKRFWV
jgi:hypothetical protein